MALSYKVFPGTPYYSNTTLTTKAGEIVNATAATYVNTTYGTVSVGGSTYYVAYGMMVSFWNSSYSGAQIDNAFGKVLNPDTTPTADSQNLITSGGVKSALTSLESCLGIVEDGNTATHAITAKQYVSWKGLLYTADSNIAIGASLASSGGSKNLTAVSNGGFNSVLSFPNYSRVLGTITAGGGSYTATENCWITGWIATNSQYTARIFVDGISVADNYSRILVNNTPSTSIVGNIQIPVFIPVKKGSVITTRNAEGNFYSLTIYGC